MSTGTLEQIRNRLWHYLSPQVADDVGLTLEELQQVAAGQHRELTPMEFETLARRIGLR